MFMCGHERLCTKSYFVNYFEGYFVLIFFFVRKKNGKEIITLTLEQ